MHLHLTWHFRHQLQLLLHHLCRAATMAVRAAALHHRPLVWADSDEQCHTRLLICLALVIFLPTVLTHLIWTNGVAMRSARDKKACPSNAVMSCLYCAWLPAREGYISCALMSSKKQKHFPCLCPVSSPAVSGRSSFCWCRGSLFFCGIFLSVFDPPTAFATRCPIFRSHVSVLSSSGSGHGPAVFVLG